METEANDPRQSVLGVASEMLLFVALSMRKRWRISANGTNGITVGTRTKMKDVIWVFRSFGFIAGVKFVWDATNLYFRRLVRREKSPKRFEELTDEEARNVAWAFGIFRWQDRQDLNEQWSRLDDRTLH